MEIGLFLSLLGFLWVAAATPGPNNMLLTTSGANFGFWRTIPLMIGIILGMQIMLLLVASGVGSLLLLYPSIHILLKFIGSLYLLWLAWKVATAAFEDLTTQTSVARKIPLWQGGLLQLVNPKAWLMTLGAVVSFSLSGSQYITSVGIISLALALINLVAGMLWILVGMLIRRFLSTPKAWQGFNLVMAGLTALSTIFIWI